MSIYIYERDEKKDMSEGDEEIYLENNREKL